MIKLKIPRIFRREKGYCVVNFDKDFKVKAILWLEQHIQECEECYNLVYSCLDKHKPKNRFEV